MKLRISLLKNKTYRRMPWKNGRGFTSEISIFPEGSTVLENNFTWRLSSADVTENGVFSNFPNCERYLSVIEGDGLQLQFKNKNITVDSKSFLKFSGDDEVYGKLLNGRVKDLNLIVKKNVHHVQLEILHTVQNKIFKGTTIIFVLEGSVRVDKETAERFDTLIIDCEQNENLIPILPGSKTKYVLITIS